MKVTSRPSRSGHDRDARLAVRPGVPAVPGLVESLSEPSARTTTASSEGTSALRQRHRPRQERPKARGAGQPRERQGATSRTPAPPPPVPHGRVVVAPLRGRLIAGRSPGFGRGRTHRVRVSRRVGADGPGILSASSGSRPRRPGSSSEQMSPIGPIARRGPAGDTGRVDQYSSAKSASGSKPLRVVCDVALNNRSSPICAMTLPPRIVVGEGTPLGHPLPVATRPGYGECDRRLVAWAKRPTRCSITRRESENASGASPRASSRVVAEQPDDATMRDKDKWQKRRWAQVSPRV